MLTGLANVGLNMWNIFPHAYARRTGVGRGPLRQPPPQSMQATEQLQGSKSLTTLLIRV